MANSGGEDEDRGEGSSDEEQREECENDVIEVDPSRSRDRVQNILRFPERNEEDTAWTRDDGTMPASVKNKLKCEDMATIRKRKGLMWTEVAKNDQVRHHGEVDSRQARQNARNLWDSAQNVMGR
jgi:hypothetical protein